MSRDEDSPPLEKKERVQTILVVEDEQLLVDLLARILTGMGFEVDTALNGTSGWQVFLDRRPDLVVTDYVMPHMNGLELLSRIRAADPFVPVVVMTVHDIKDQAFGLGANGFLTKPFRLEEMRQLVRRLAPRAGSRRD